jgi:hypothetical protein
LRVQDKPEWCVEEEIEGLLDRRLAFRHAAMLVDAPDSKEIPVAYRSDRVNDQHVAHRMV